MTVTYLVGDVRERMADIPDGSVSLVASSPPFLALRSYLPADHASKGDEIGSEANPAAFLDTLLGLTAEWGRVLAPWGSIAIELGDTYSGSAGDNWHKSVDKIHATNGADSAPSKIDWSTGWPAAKSLALIPQLYAIALAYGINPLTGAASPAGQWLVRNVITWHRPNPAVGALGDKYRPSTSYIVVATRSPRRWFDLDAVRGDVSAWTQHYAENDYPGSDRAVHEATKDGARSGGLAVAGDLAGKRIKAQGAPPLDTWFDADHHDTWTITTQPSRLAHYAMWPPKLAERLILSMCPEWVCTVCGEPRRRVVGEATYVKSATYRGGSMLADSERVAERVNQWNGDAGGKASVIRSAPTLGWSDCGHDAFRPGVTLDPFAGTGTTLAVAHLHGRDATGIDIDPRNHDLYPARLDECRRALFGTQPEMPGQLDLFEEPA